MKPSHAKFLALLGTVVLGAIQSGCKPSPVGPSPAAVPVGNPDRLVTISPGSGGACEVDYPVASLKQNQKPKHTISWATESGPYWILFDNRQGGLGSPIDPSNKPIKVAPTAGKFDVEAASPNYYKYAIYTSDPSATPQPPPCKDFDNDHDTGLNVKR